MGETAYNHKCLKRSRKRRRRRGEEKEVGKKMKEIGESWLKSGLGNGWENQEEKILGKTEEREEKRSHLNCDCINEKGGGG